MISDQIVFWAIVGLIVCLVGLCFWLFRDNLRLREAIRVIGEEKDNLAAQLKSSIDQQKAILDVLKYVMQGEIKTARTSEREDIFSTALMKLTAIEREININLSQIGDGTHVGQAATGTGNHQEMAE